ncbi:hypothetical protein L7F22_012943 [Adiantum nelumboides]|nr:hypothetical protein [Adiantum nelumboides]
MSLSGMRGLSVFISDIRNCQNKEQERLRVDKELANIRTRFKNEKGLTVYEKKKYVWKMLYIYMLGYDVDFGHMETVALISASKYAEKQVGYIVTSCLLNENHDFLRLAINTVRNDIIGRNETNQCMALTMVGNIGGKDFSESLAPDVQKLLLSSSCRPVVRKKAALCLLRLFRKNPDVVNVDGWSDRMAQLLDEREIGVLTAVMSLLVALVANNPDGYWNCVPKCVRILERLTRSQDIPQEYTYYGIPSPWLQVKTMRALQYFPTIEDPNTRRSLFEVLHRILMGTDVVKNVNKNNAAHAVLFEALALVMHLDAEKEMMSQCVAILGKFIAVREPNIRYLGLENMTRMLLVTDVQESIKRHQAQIITSLKDPDIRVSEQLMDGQRHEHYLLKDGFMMMHGRLCVTRPLRRKVKEESHVPPYAGHRGIDATVNAVETFFYWLTLRRDVDAFVRECIICQMVKFDRQKAPGLLQPLPIPDKPWESIAMDFIFDLPRTQTGNDGIWTIICRFSKQAHFIPVRKKIKPDQMARLFMSNISKYHGMPQSIVSDRDPCMTSLFWRGLFENMGTTLKFSLSFHPQTDGQSEEENSTVLDLLKCYVSKRKGKWEQYLPLVEYAYNNTMHSSTGKAPFEIVEGGKKVPPILHTKDTIFEADKYVQDMDEMYKKVKVALEKTQAKQKKAADRHCREVVFSL